MSKYNDDEYVEFMPISDKNLNNGNDSSKEIDDDITSEIDLADIHAEVTIDAYEEETNSYTRESLPLPEEQKFQIHYSILRDKLPAIIVFHCSGALKESNCLVLHNTFKMCNSKNLPFIIFDMTDVVSVEKEVWIYFSSKASKNQKLNGILLFAGIRSDVLSDTTDFHKLNICHCDTVETCCVAIRNLVHEHEKTDISAIHDDSDVDASNEIQSNIHEFLYNEKKKSDEVKKGMDIRNRKDIPEASNSSFEKTVLFSNDGSNPIAEAKKKVMQELGKSPIENTNQSSINKGDTKNPTLDTSNSAFEETILFNKDGSNPITEAKKRVMLELGKSTNENTKLHDTAFEETIIINSDGSNPIAEAKKKVMLELGKSVIGDPIPPSVDNSKGDIKKSTLDTSTINDTAFEKTILINDDGSNPIAEARKKVMQELGRNTLGETRLGSIDNSKGDSKNSTLDTSTLNDTAFEKTILINDDGSNPIAEAKKRVMQELGRNTLEETRLGSVDNSKSDIKNSTLDSSTINDTAFEKTILINDDGANPIAEARKKVRAESVNIDTTKKKVACELDKVDFSNPTLFEKTVLFSDDESNPIAEAKKKVLQEMKANAESKVSEDNKKDKNPSSFPSSSSALASTSPYIDTEKTILFNDNGTNPIAEAKKKVLQEMKANAESKFSEDNKKDKNPSSPSLSSFPSSTSALASTAPNIDTEKTILFNNDGSNPIAEAKKKVLQEMKENAKNKASEDNKKENNSSSHSSFSSTSISASTSPSTSIDTQKTILFNNDGSNPIAEAKKKVLQEMKANTESKVLEGNKKDNKPSSPSVPSFPSSTSTLASTSPSSFPFIDDSMSTDYSISEPKKTPVNKNDDEVLPLIDESVGVDYSPNDRSVMSKSATVDIPRTQLGLTTNKIVEDITIQNISPNDPFSIHYGVYDTPVESKSDSLPAGKTESEKLTAQELVFQTIANFGPCNILQMKNHINDKLDKKDRINTIKLFSILKQLDLDTHEKRVRYYRSC